MFIEAGSSLDATNKMPMFGDGDADFNILGHYFNT
tara:strand:+ start:640 stop:744 length:105 start_codon:yes stop_codon:yes gene_type:complete